MAQSVKRLTLDFGSSQDLTVCETEPSVGLCADSAESAWDSLSLSASTPLSCSLSGNKYISLQKEKKEKRKKKHIVAKPETS